MGRAVPLSALREAGREAVQGATPRAELLRRSLSGDCSAGGSAPGQQLDSLSKARSTRQGDLVLRVGV